jgi:hypothetical protein
MKSRRFMYPHPRRQSWNRHRAYHTARAVRCRVLDDCFGSRAVLRRSLARPGQPSIADLPFQTQ